MKRSQMNLVRLLLLLWWFSIVDALMVHDAVRLNRIVSRNSDHEQIKLEWNWREHNGLLLVVHNRLEMAHSSCSAWDTVLVFESGPHRLHIGCAHYMVFDLPLSLQLFQAHLYLTPLNISVLSSVFHEISKYLSITVTAIRFSCQPNHSVYRQCPNAPDFCIGRHLFCDGVDNCGLNADEQDCGYWETERILISVVDDRDTFLHYLYIGLAVFSVSAMVTMTLIIWYYRRKANKHRNRARYRTVLGINDLAEAEETVALLSFGIQNQFIPGLALPSMPVIPRKFSSRLSKPSLALPSMPIIPSKKKDNE